MRYLIHPKGRPSAAQWVSAEQWKQIKAHYHGQNMVVAEEDSSPSEFGHPRPILPNEAKAVTAKATTEASPAPQQNKGKTNGA